MNNRKLKLHGVLIGAFVFLFVSMAMAQQGTGKGQRQGGQRVSIDERVARMMQELDLTDEQAGEIRLVLEEARATRPNVRIMNPEEARPVLCKHMLSTDAAIKEVLSDEQGAEYDVLKESRKAGKGGGRGRGPVDCSEFESAD